MANILIVDDEPILRMSVQRVLDSEGHTISMAENGGIGVEMAKAEKPDLIVMDLNMPVMDGFQATRAIRKEPKNSGVKILVLTAETMTANYEAVYEAGADAYLSKPIDYELLVERVTELLNPPGS